MKKLMPFGMAAMLLLAAAGVSAQTKQMQHDTTGALKTKPADRGSAGAITMEEYETLLKQYQEKNPGKTFQSMSKEEFETYLTTELAALRKKRAEEAAQKETQKAAEPKH